MRADNDNRIRMRFGRGRGFSLLELGLTMGIVALALVAMVQLSSDAARQVQDSATADRLNEVSQAAVQYLQAQSQSLIASIPVGGTTYVPVGRTSLGASIPPNSLQAMGYLPATYVDVNSYNQSSMVVIRQTTAGNLDLMVETVNGQTISDLDLGRISSKVGAIGGMIQSNPPPGVANGTIQGAGGGYSELASSWVAGGVLPTAGHAMAVTYSNQTTVLADYLYRNNIGVAEANRMHTSIDMTHNNLNAVAAINNTDQTSGTNAPITVGSVLQGTGGGQVQVQNGLDACVGGATDCTLAVSANGGFHDENDGWIRFRGPNASGGLALDDTGGADNLYVQGSSTIIGQTSTYGGVALHNNTSIIWPDITNAYLTADYGSGFLHYYGGGFAASGDIDAGGNLNATSGSVNAVNVNATNSVAGSSVSATSAMGAPIYYDSNNYSYYVVPSGTSNLNVITANAANINGNANISGTATMGASNVTNDETVGGNQTVSGSITTYGSINATNGEVTTQALNISTASGGIVNPAGYNGGPMILTAIPPLSPNALQAYGNVQVLGRLCTSYGCY